MSDEESSYEAKDVPLLDALLNAGALDATAAALWMKKGRSGLLVTALSTQDKAAAVTEAMLRHGSTFGVRQTTAERTVLDRWFEEVDTPWGTVTVKIGALNGEVLHASPEFETVAAVAHASGRPVPEIHAAAMAAWRNQSR